MGGATVRTGDIRRRPRAEGGAAMNVPPELIQRLKRMHPLQYGYLPGSDDPVFDPGDDPNVTERINRCPVCEQWSPCDVRELIDIATGVIPTP